jgi:hypothetical protein
MFLRTVDKDLRKAMRKVRSLGLDESIPGLDDRRGDEISLDEVERISY